MTSESIQKKNPLVFPEDEIEPRRALSQLFHEWQAAMVSVMPEEQAYLKDLK